MADMVRGPRPQSGSKADDDVVSAAELNEERLYEEIESGPEFRALERSKLKFIIPATIFFMVYYFALPVLVGFFGVEINPDGTTKPGFMDTRLFNGFSVAYLFALSQFIMAWILAFIYLLAFAPRIDQMVRKIVNLVVAHNTRQANKGGK